MVKSDRGNARFHKSWATHGPQVGHGAGPYIAMTLGPCTLFAHGDTTYCVEGSALTVAWTMYIPRKSLILVRLAGIEPTTLGFGGRYSIH